MKDVPTGPLVGDRVTAGAVTVKFADAMFPLVSLATTGYTPAFEKGTAIVVENEPSSPVVAVAAAVPLNLMLTVKSAPNPVPSTVTVWPTLLVDGVKVIAGEMTVNVVDAVFV